MEERLKKQVWQRFVTEGALDSARMNKQILESWYYCRHSGVNPFDGKGARLLSMEALKEKQQQNAELIEIALPFLNNLHSLFKHTKSILLLVDPEGYVLKVIGEEDALKHASDINFVEGIQWTEEQVGTNAIGTALRAMAPLTVRGAEHYSVASQNWVCSAAPVKDEDGELLGVIDVSSRTGSCDHDHTLGAVVASAFAIEYEWQKRQKEDEIELMGKALSLKDYADPFVLTDRKGRIVYIPSALKKLVSYRHEKLPSATLAELGYNISMTIPVFSNQTGRMIGRQLSLSENHKLICTSRASTVKSLFKFEGVTGVSSTFRTVLREAARVAGTDIPVHITGETGTGKEILARALHANSLRKHGPFIEMNCGAVPASLMESELFGYAPGAFTGAKKSGYKGKLAEAEGGTLFLDEIGEMSHSMQVALLKVLDNMMVTPLGSSREIKLNIRLITATNKDLIEMLKSGELREDFYYRLFVYPLMLPPLRERKEDISYFIKWYCEKHDWMVHWTEEAVRCLEEFPWPGNIRQLLNSLDRVRVCFPDSVPTADELKELIFEHPSHSKPLPGNRPEPNPLTFREKVERDKMKQLIEESDGKVAVAIKKMAMPRSTFYRKLKKYDL